MATTFKWFGLVAATLALVGCSADATDNGEQVGESEDHLLAGRRVTPSEIASLLRQAGFPSSAIGKMVCTAKYESNFYERASNHNRNGTTDYGLFQINSVHFGDRGCPSSSAALYNASTNVRCAKAVYDSQGIGAWYGYKKHKSECDRYAAPAGSTAPTAPSNSSSSGSGSSSGGSSGSTDPIGADDPTDGSDLGASSSSGGSDPATPDDVGGCWSATLQDMVDANTCVQSQSNGIWYQCHEGQWYRGVSGSDGPYGACTSVHSL